MENFILFCLTDMYCLFHYLRLFWTNCEREIWTVEKDVASESKLTSFYCYTHKKATLSPVKWELNAVYMARNVQIARNSTTLLKIPNFW